MARATILRKGSRGREVTRLQEELNRKGARPPLKVDGIFGPRTEAAVRNFQKGARLRVDGIAGPRTMGALGLEGAGKARYQVVVDGKKYVLTEKEWKEGREKVLKEFGRLWKAYHSKYREALEIQSVLAALNNDQVLVSWVSHLLSGARPPSDKEMDSAQQALTHLRAAVDRRDLKGSVEAATEVVARVGNVLRKTQEYRGKLVKGAGRAVTTLQTTEAVSFAVAGGMATELLVARGVAAVAAAGIGKGAAELVKSATEQISSAIQKADAMAGWERVEKVVKDTAEAALGEMVAKKAKAISEAVEGVMGKALEDAATELGKGLVKGVLHGTLVSDLETILREMVGKKTAGGSILGTKVKKQIKERIADWFDVFLDAGGEILLARLRKRAGSLPPNVAEAVAKVASDEAKSSGRDLVIYLVEKVPGFAADLAARIRKLTGKESPRTGATTVFQQQKFSFERLS